MSKAVEEVGIGAAAIGLAIAMPGIGAGLDWMTAGMQSSIIGGLASIGGSSIMAGIADALRGDQGGLAVGVTTPIGPWGYVYGTQKVGGVEIFRESNSSQGTSNDKQLHRVYALACHPCQIGATSDVFQLRIDGKQVLLEPSSDGYPNSYNSVSPSQSTSTVTSISRASNIVTMVLATPIADQDGLTLQVTNVADNTFNGTWTVTQPNPTNPAILTYVCGGPDTSTSGGNVTTTYPDYQDKIYLEFLNGNHTATFPGLLGSGTTWGASDLCLGRTMAYVRMGYDATVFPSSIPNVSFVIQGKNNIYDPREGGGVGYTDNAALCIADYLCTPVIQGGFGMTMGVDVPAAALIAAANLCDEPVGLAGGGSQARYTCNTFFQLNTPRGTILKNLLSSCAGRLSYQGGQYQIFPGGWVAPTFSLTDADLVGPIQWKPRFSIRDTCNAVKGTYVSPENAYQQADVPPYMQDAMHGYVADPWLAEDNGERIFRECNFPCTDSSATAQQLAKIVLLRTRWQGRGTLQCNLNAYQIVALDVIQFTHPRYTWLNKTFEVLATRFNIDKSNGAPRPVIELDIAETDSSVYEWNLTDQLTPFGYQQPNNVGNSICAPPEDPSSYSGTGATIDGIVYPSTITTGADGRVQNSIYVRWDTPNDANVVSGGHLELQWQPNGGTSWSALPNISPVTSSIFITGVTDGITYNVKIRAVNCAGVPSAWISVPPAGVSYVWGISYYSGIAVAPPGTLTAIALSGGTAQINIADFTPFYGPACTLANPTISGLAQGQLYFVYYVDQYFAGGIITAIATENESDCLNKEGYFLIGSVTTPTFSPRYQPSAWSSNGTVAPTNPAAAYDNNTSTDAILMAQWWSINSGGSGPPVWSSASANCGVLWEGFPSAVTTAPLTLNVLVAFVTSGSSGTTFSGSVVAMIGSTPTTLCSFTAAATEATYTMTIPTGTNLSTVTVQGTSSIGASGTLPGSGYCSLEGFEVWIQ